MRAAATKSISEQILRKRLAGKSWYKWAALALVTNMGLQNYMDRVAVYSLFPLLRSDLHATDLELGLLGTMFLIVYGALSPLAGALGDRFSRRAVLLASFLGWSLATLLSGFARTALQLVALRGLLAVGQVPEIPVGQALVADFHSRETRARATSIHVAGMTIGIILSGILAGSIGQDYGWRAVFYLLGSVGLASWLFSFYLLADPPKNRPEPEPAVSIDAHSVAARESIIRGFWQVLRQRPVWPIMGMFFFTGVTNWAVMTWLPLYLYEGHGRTLAQAGFEANFYGQVGGGSILAWAWLSDHWSSKNPKGCVWTQIIGLLFGFPVFLFLGLVQSHGLLILFMLAAGAAMASIDATTMPVLCEAVEPNQRATAYGFLNLCGTIAGALVSYLIGFFMKRFGLGPLLSLSSVFYLVGASCMFWAVRRCFERESCSEEPR